MKKKYLLSEFLLVLIFLILPPIFTGKIESGNSSMTGGGSFYTQIIPRALIAIALHLQYSFFIAKEKDGDKKTENFKRFLLGLAWWAITLGLLMISEAFFTALSILFKIEGNGINFIPKGSAEISACISNIFVGAVYEEAVYREFLPETLSWLIEKKRLEIPMELICVTLFALAHRYLGLMAVLNAFVCGIILRLCYKKSGDIWAGIHAHIIYNSIQLLFLIFSS